MNKYFLIILLSIGCVGFMRSGGPKDNLQNVSRDEIRGLRETMKTLDYPSSLILLIAILEHKSKMSGGNRNIRAEAEAIIDLLDEKIAENNNGEPTVPFLENEPLFLRYPDINYAWELSNAVGWDYFKIFRRAIQDLGMTYPIDRHECLASEMFDF